MVARPWREVPVKTLDSFCRQIGEISLADKQVVSIENLYKHRGVFEPLTRDRLFVATPGTSNPDWKLLRFERLPRPIWPLDPDPLGLDAE